jgi:hypothetical protein
LAARLRNEVRKTGFALQLEFLEFSLLVALATVGFLVLKFFPFFMVASMGN